MKMIKPAALLLLGLLGFSAFGGQPVNVNDASAEQLAHGLDGVGLSKAEAIIAYRQEHGSFKHADELVNVKGIGLRTVEKNRDYIRVSQQASKSTKKPQS